MRINNKIARFISFILLLVFLQKMGPRLYLHNCYHSKSSQLPLSSNHKSFDTSCDCMDDFSTAFLQPISSYNLFIPVHFIQFEDRRSNNHPSTQFLFITLRGPPVFFTL